MPDEFEDMTWSNYQRLIVHHYKKEANQWDMTRSLMSYILNTQVEKKHQKKPKEILPLWIDKYYKHKPKGTIKPATPDEKREMLEKFNSKKKPKI